MKGNKEMRKAGATGQAGVLNEFCSKLWKTVCKAQGL